MSGLARHGDLKLRASYSVTGSRDIAGKTLRWRLRGANYGATPGIERAISEPVGEQTHEVNWVRLLLGERRTLLGDWYRKETPDLLLDADPLRGQTHIAEYRQHGKQGFRAAAQRPDSQAERPQGVPLERGLQHRVEPQQGL
jgi:hypothetical protein